MHTLLAVGFSLLTTVAANQAQPSVLSTNPITLTFLERVTFEEVMTTVGQLSQMTVEFDQTVSEELRRSPIGKTITMRDVTLEQVIGVMSTMKGLTYRIDGKTIVIFKKP